MRLSRIFALLLIWLGSALPQAVQAAEPLRLGLFPNLSPRALIAMYQPLRLHLEQALGRPVQLETAPGFHVFIQRLLAREYDLAVAAPHLSRLAQLDAGYWLVAHYQQPVEACLVTRAKEGESLRPGIRLAIPDQTAVVSMLGMEVLEAQGLRQGRDYQYLEAKSHSNAALWVTGGQADAAVIGCVPMSQLPQDVRDRLRLLARSRAIPSQYFLASSRLSPAERAQLNRALLAFASSPAGREFIQNNSLRGLAVATQDELAGMDGFAAQARELSRQAAGH